MTNTLKSTPNSLPDRLTGIVQRAELQADSADFNQKFKEELDQLKLSKEELSELAQKFEQSKVERIKNDAKAVIAEHMKGERESLAKSIDPRTWSNETKSKAVMATGGIVIGGIVLGWIASKLAKASEGARTAVRRVRNMFLLAIGGAAVLVGGYVGFQAWKNWGEMKKQFAILSGTVEKAKRATGEAKEKLDKKAEELQKKYEEMQKKFNVPKSENSPTESPIKPGEGIGIPLPVIPGIMPSEKTKEKIKETAEQAEVEAKRALERAGLELTGTTLLLMNSTRATQAGITEEAEKNAVRSALNEPFVQKLKVSELRSINSQADAATRLPTSASDAEKKALFFLALATRDMEARITETLPKDGSIQIDSLSLKEIIDRIHHVPKIFQRVRVAMQGKSWKDIGDITQVFQAAFADGSLADLQSDANVMRELDALGLKGKEALFFSECLGQGRSTFLKNINIDAPDEDRKAVQKALIRIREELTSPETIGYLTKYLHNQKDFPFAQELETHLREHLLVVDAVQLYAYLRIARKGNTYPESVKDSNPVGALLLQMKIIDILGKTNKNLAERMRAFLVVEAPKALGPVTLPDGTREFLMTILSETSNYALDFGQDKLQENTEKFFIWASQVYKSYPRETITASLSTVGIAGGVGTRLGYVHWQKELMERLADKLATTTEVTKRPFIHRLTPAGVEAYRIAKSADLADQIHGINNKISVVTDAKLRKALEHEYLALYQRRFTDRSFTQFYSKLDELKKAGAPASVIDEITEAVKTKIHPFKNTLEIRRGAFIFEHATKALGIAAQGYVLYEDLKGVGEAYEQENKMHDYANNVMKEIRAQLKTSAGFEEVPGKPGVYKHKDSGVEVSLTQVQKQIQDGDNGLESKTYAQYMRTGVSAASLAATIFMGAKVFTGPAGLAIVGVEIAVRTGIEIWEEGKLREFIKDAPPWLLTLLGSEMTTGKSEMDWLTKSSSWMLSDITQSGTEQQTAAEKASIRQKMLFTIFNHDLQTFAPELFADITQGLNSPPLLDTLYNGDFQTFILPAFQARLFQLAESNNVTWSSFGQNKIDGGLIVFPPDVTLVQIRTAMRDAAVLYSQHLHEARYKELLRSREQAASSPNGIDPMLEAAILNAGNEKAFGKGLLSLSPEIIAENGNKTRAQILIETLRKNIQSAKGDTRAEKLKANPDVFSIEGNSIAGLELTFRFDRKADILALIDDPVMREKLSQIFAETTKEKEGADTPSWKEWQNTESWQKWLKPADAVEDDNTRYNTMIAANFIRKALKMPDVAPNSSNEAAARAITESGIAYMAEHRGNSIARNAAWERAMYKGNNQPLVFTSLRAGDTQSNWQNLSALCDMLRTPRISQKEFGEENLVAVFFEGRTMEQSGHDVVLATYVYADEKNKDSANYRIIQQSAATSATTNSKGLNAGLAVAMNLPEFLSQPNAEIMLKGLEQGRDERKKEAAHQEREKTQFKSKEDALWASKKPQRDALEKTNKEAREEALKRSKQPNSLVYVPGAYERDEEKHIFHLGEAAFYGTVDGQTVIIPLLRNPDQPSMSALTDRSKVWKPTEAELLTFKALGKDQNWNYKVDFEKLINQPNESFTLNDQKLTRAVLTRPFDLKGHPRQNDEKFIEYVSKQELLRVLNIATYEEFSGVNATECRNTLFDSLLPLYMQASNKTTFLTALVDGIKEVETISANNYQRILKKVQK